MARLPWLVVDMDEGLLRREPTRAAAVKWCRNWYGPVMERHSYSPGAYSYTFGVRGEDRATFLFVEREDVAKSGAGSRVWNSTPKYPHPDRPYDEDEGNFKGRV